MFYTKCSSESVFKSGFVKSAQLYKCKECSRQFVPTRHHGKTQTEKLTAILLYINGLSLRTIARLMHVTATAILKWVRQYALENYEKPKPQTNTTTVAIELDEVWHYLQRKKTSFGFGRHIVALPIDSLTGNAGIVIAGLFSECLVGFTNGM
jgi:transposase-like protein